MSWEQRLPRNSVSWGRGKGGAWLLNIFSLVLAKPELLVPRVSGIFLFKDAGAAEISLSSFPSTQPTSFPHLYKGDDTGTCLTGSGCLAWSKSSINWSDDEGGDEEEAEWIQWKLKSSFDVETLGDGRASEQSWGDVQRS